LTGKDQQGRNASYSQQLGDLLKNVVPMPAQGVFSTEPGAVASQLEKGVGVNRSPNRSAAENLAIQKASARNSQGAVPQEQLDAHRRVLDMIDQLRAGQITNQQVVQALKDGSISRQTAEKIIKDSRMSPLSSRVSSLPINDALDVYAIATSKEKAELQSILLKKIESFRKTEAATKTPQQRAFIEQRIQRVLGLGLTLGATHHFNPATQKIETVQ